METCCGKKIIKSIIKVFSIALLFSNISIAQWTFGISTDQEYNSNPFRSPLATKSFISTVDFGLENDLNSFSIGYYGSYINFNELSDRNFYWHQFAIWKDLENGTFGLYAEQRLNRELYNYFDYTNYTAYYLQKFNVSDFYFSVNPHLSLSKYENISILDNLKGSLALNLNHGFETETTLILGGTFTYKKYLDPTQSGQITYLNESNQLVTEKYTDKNVSSITQILSYLRVAQSLGDKTGIAAQFTNRSIINGFANQVKELNMIYGDESEIFDDPVNFEGNSIALELTKILGEDWTFKLGYYINNKFYPSQGIYNALSEYNTNIMRTDVQNIFDINLKKSFPLNEAETTSLSLRLNYQYINNKSNSYWFQYNGNSFNVGLSLEF
ncbi:MAG: hypothetical protein GYA14_11260 [Ignavibacteria bacterium]|nr:hypothetical protein [Ignavibacteria bacterium]